MIDIARARAYTSKRSRIQRVASDFYPFKGGLNLIDSPLVADPGQVQNALNYEMGFDGGYRRIGGYEKMTGQPSVSDPAYWKIPFSATEKPIRIAQGTTSTQPKEVVRIISSSGGDAGLINIQDSGGYGVNMIPHNGWLENQEYWDRTSTGIWNNLVYDLEWKWPNGPIAGLARLREDTANSTHYIQTVTSPISVAAGDILYVSCLALYRQGIEQAAFRADYDREGIRLEIVNAAAGTWSAAGNPYAEFSAKHCKVVGQSNQVYKAGCEHVSDNVVRCWAMLHIAETADAAMDLRIGLLAETSPGVFANSYQGDGGMVHIGAPMAVKWEHGRAPHNLANGFNNFNSTTYWNPQSMTMIDADLAWGGTNPHSSFSKFTEPASGTQASGIFIEASNTVASYGSTGAVPMVEGDSVKVRFYVRFTAGQTAGLYLVIGSGANEAFTAFPFTATEIIDIEGGTVGDTLGAFPSQPNMAKSRLTLVDTNTYLYEGETVPVQQTGSTAVGFYAAQETGTPGQWTFSHTHSSQYFHLTGFQCWVGKADGIDEMPRMAEVITDVNPRKCPTGHLIVTGRFIGQWKDGDTLDAMHYPDFAQEGDMNDIDWQRWSWDSGVLFGDVTGPPELFGESDETLDTQYRTKAAALALDWNGEDTPSINIHPPGAGPIRGVWIHKGSAYCWRDSGDGSKGLMYKATCFGWQRVAHLYVVNFDAGTGAEPAVGDLVFCSNNRGFVRYIETTSGTWGVDAAGYMLIDPNWHIESPTTTDEPARFPDGQTILEADIATTIATVNGDSTRQSFPAGGKYEFRSHNFYGQSDRSRIYGVNGVGTAFEFNAQTDILRFIPTGAATDTPTHLAVHNYHLILGYPGGSTQISGDGDPLSWTIITGASEIAVGDEITGYVEEISDSLLILTRDQTWILNGNNRADFNLDDFNVNAGAHEWSVQRIGLATYFDDRGFTSLRQSSRGDSVNYQENTVSELIQPLIEDLVQNAEVTTSHLIRNRNLYRCYFDDGRIISIGFDKHKVSGHMQVEYPFVANVACSEEDASGAERILVGTMDGEVYELEVGPSFAGEQINAFMRTVLYPSQSPGTMKKYTHARLDGTFRGSLTMAGRVEFDYDDPDWNLGAELDFSADAAGGYWDDFVWDSFIWDKTKSGQKQVKLEGEGTNISIYLAHNSTIDLPHTLRGMSFQWHKRRDDRRT